MADRREGRFLPVPFLYALLLLFLSLSFCLGLANGSVDLTLPDILRALREADVSSLTYKLVIGVRLPRVLAGLFAGIGLSCAGVILQAVMNNSLASPNTIGVNSGAGFAVMLCMVLFPGSLKALPIGAFLGALCTTLLIFSLAYFTNSSRVTIVLAGVAVSSFVNAGINTLKLLHSDVAVNATAFMLGTLSNMTMKQLVWPCFYIILAFLLAWCGSNSLNILSLGENVAGSLGLRVNVVRFAYLALASSLAGSVVSFSGLLSFVGLIVPHICRQLFGNDLRRLLPCSALLGGSFVILCDLLGRVLFSPYELPVGIIMAFIGGPFFIFLLLKKGKRLNA